MLRSLLLTLIACLATAPAFAQVTVDLRALDALPHAAGHEAPAPDGAHRTHPSHRRRASRHGRHVVRKHVPPAVTPTPVVVVPQKSPAQVATTPAPSTAPAAPPPAATLPAKPPVLAVIPPVTPPPAPAAPAPPPVPPVAAAAKTAAANVPTGLQLTFASGESDLSPASVDAIKRFIAAAPAGKAGTFNVLAYAADVPHDPSAPRRLSLSRAIAVRTAMLAEGVSSAAIYLRALGAQGGSGPPDRVDISVQGTGAPVAAAQGGANVPATDHSPAASTAGTNSPGANLQDAKPKATLPSGTSAPSGAKSQ